VQALPLHLTEGVDGVDTLNLDTENLFDRLPDLGLGSLLINDEGVGLAVYNRLLRSAGFEVIEL